jgi:uncharacterized protein YndB with AHSA1/START domain
MVQRIRPAPVRKTLELKVPQARAFEVFTAQMTQWWPRSHTIGSAPMREMIIEPRVAGRWYAVGEDGSEADNGRVLAWEPPSRLLLDWQITADWRFDPEFHTQIEVRFIAAGPGATRVEFEHRDLERFGDRAEQVRGQIEPGWGMILERYTQATASGAAAREPTP